MHKPLCGTYKRVFRSELHIKQIEKLLDDISDDYVCWQINNIGRKELKRRSTQVPMCDMQEGLQNQLKINWLESC